MTRRKKKKKKKTKRSVGRPRIEIDWEEFDQLCGLQCTLGEIAGWFRCSEDTIERACKRKFGKNFAEAFTEKRVSGKISLRRRQYQAAQDGDRTMLVWLGKQWLGQQDSLKHTGPDGGPVRVQTDVVFVDGEDDQD